MSHSLLRYSIRGEPMSDEEVTRRAQTRPRSRACTVWVDIEGESLSIPEIARRAGVSQNTVRSRMARGKWGKALLAPKAEKKSLTGG